MEVNILEIVVLKFVVFVVTNLVKLVMKTQIREVKFIELAEITTVQESVAVQEAITVEVFMVVVMVAETVEETAGVIETLKYQYTKNFPKDLKKINFQN